MLLDNEFLRRKGSSLPGCSVPDSSSPGLLSPRPVSWASNATPSSWPQNSSEGPSPSLVQFS